MNNPEPLLSVITPSGEKYLPILLECLQVEQMAPCDLYLQAGNDGPLFFARKGLEFNELQNQKLRDQGVTHVLIRDEEAPLYFDYLKETITAIVRNPTCSPKKKASAVHSACQDIMSRVFSDPRASFIGQAHEILSPTIELIITDDNATRHLIQLTAYDHYTYTHSTNVGIFSVALARLFYRTDQLKDIERLGCGFFLHDLGKCKIPIEILHKPEKLAPQEWQTIQKHPEDGYAMLEEAGFLTDEARIITLQHHEKEDGSGYPRRLRRADIHPYARICRLADVYDAITSDRPYSKRMSTFAALKLMKEKLLSDMDQEFFEHFVKLFRA